MKRIIIVLLSFCLIALTGGCAAPSNAPAPTQAPAATVQPATAQTTEATAAPTAAADTHVFSDIEPAAPYLRVSHDVNGQYVNGYIALTAEDIATAQSSPLRDTSDAISLKASPDAEETYGLQPQTYVDPAERLCGFLGQSPSDVKPIQSATFTITQFEQSRAKTVTDPALLTELAASCRARSAFSAPAARGRAFSR